MIDIVAQFESYIVHDSKNKKEAAMLISPNTLEADCSVSRKGLQTKTEDSNRLTTATRPALN